MAEKTKKKGKGLLIAGLVLLGLVLVIGGGFGITGSILFLRDAIFLAVLGGAGVAVGIPASKGVAALFSKIFGGKNKDKTQERTIVKERTKEKTKKNKQEQTKEEVVDLKSVPKKETDYGSVFEGVEEEIEKVRKENTKNKTTSKGR